MRNLPRPVIFAAIVLVAIGLVAWRYHDYLVNPWTRDGQVMANVIRIAPRVSGPVIELPIRDNQRVAAGDLLFRIDPRTFETDLALAEAKLDRTVKNLVALDKQITAAEAVVAQGQSAITQAQSDVDAKASTLVDAKKTLDRNTALVKVAGVSRSDYDQALRDYQVNQAAKRAADAALLGAQSRLSQAQADRGLIGPQNAQLREAQAGLESARLNLSFTEVRASVSGMISNLNIRLGSQAVVNQPFMALIDENSFWIDAYFRETLIADVSAGNAAIITLMGYPDTPLRGRVDSVGWGIAVENGSTGQNLLPSVAPTFQWIRLAQRIPVRVMLEELPKSVVLRVGQTASVLVRTGSENDKSRPVAAPTILQ